MSIGAELVYYILHNSKKNSEDSMGGGSLNAPSAWLSGKSVGLRLADFT